MSFSLTSASPWYLPEENGRRLQELLRVKEEQTKKKAEKQELKKKRRRTWDSCVRFCCWAVPDKTSTS